MTKYSKNHRTIYCDGGIWDSIQGSAKLQGRSVSNYLVNLHNANLVCSDLGFAPEKVKPDVPAEKPIPMKPIEIPDDFVEPLAKAKVVRAEANLGQEDYLSPDPAAEVASKLGRIVSMPKKVVFKKKSKSLPSGCSECRAPFGHRPGCSLERGV